MKKFANTFRPWLGILALALGGVAACAGGTADNTRPATSGSAGSTQGAAGSTQGTAGSTSGSAGSTTSGSAGSSNPEGTAGTSGSAGASGTGGAGAGAGMAGSAGATGSAGAGTAGAGSAGATGTAGAGGAGGTGTVAGFPGPFSCTLVAGLLTTSEWYNAGFENDGVDGTKWEGKFQHYGYIDIWAQDPPAGFSWNAPITSACTTNSATPDRVIWVAFSWELAYMVDVYVQKTVQAIKQFQKYYPSMKRMDLMTLIRCPGDELTNPTGIMCNPNAKIPPIAGVTDHNAGQQDCYVNKEVDQALDMAAAQFPGLVYIGKKFYSPACKNPVDGAHLGGNNTPVAKDIATWYKDPTHL
jgi:hypothetical protein